MQENSQIRIEQVNTLCYYYAHFTAERAQLKKKKLQQKAQIFWSKTLFSFLHFFLATKQKDKRKQWVLNFLLFPSHC